MFQLKKAAIVAGLLAGLPVRALAHVATLEAPGWTTEPWLIGSLALSFILYAVGAARLFRRSGFGRAARRREIALFSAGWAVLVVAAASPLHEAGERSFTLHMIEHELLMLVAGPLLVASRPLGAMIWAFPTPARLALSALGRQGWLRWMWSTLCDPIVATVLQAGALWIWHAPSLFDLALSSEGWHIAQHLSFFISALCFWQAMLSQPRVRLGVAAICLFATSVVAGALGALMAFSQSPWYERYALLGMAPFGLSAVEDQQLAGLLMWIPGGLVHAGAALFVITKALDLGGRSPSGSNAAPTSSDPRSETVG